MCKILKKGNFFYIALYNFTLKDMDQFIDVQNTYLNVDGRDLLDLNLSGGKLFNFLGTNTKDNLIVRESSSFITK